MALGDTYTPDNKYDEQVSKYRSVVGDNPEAIKQAVAKDMIANDQQLQESVQGQQGAVSALQQLGDYDKELANQFKAGNQQQMQATTQFQQQAAQMGSVDGTNAQATIASGPAQFSTQQITQSQPTNALLNPFVASGLVTGQSQAATGTFDLASQLRGSRERAIGTEAEAIARIAATKIEQERIQRELEEKRRQQEEERRLAEFERQRQYAEAFGGEAVDPTTGQKYTYKSPQERIIEEESRKKAAEQAIFQKVGKSGKTLYDEVTDGKGSFIDIIRENPGLTEDEILALARVNVSRYGAFGESPEDLTRMGLGVLLKDPSLIGSSAKSDDDYINEILGRGTATVQGQNAPGYQPQPTQASETIRVVNKATGQVGNIPINEYDPSKYEPETMYNSRKGAMNMGASLIGTIPSKPNAAYEGAGNALLAALTGGASAAMSNKQSSASAPKKSSGSQPSSGPYRSSTLNSMTQAVSSRPRR